MGKLQQLSQRSFSIIQRRIGPKNLESAYGCTLTMRSDILESDEKPPGASTPSVKYPVVATQVEVQNFQLNSFRSSPSLATKLEVQNFVLDSFRSP